MVEINAGSPSRAGHVVSPAHFLALCVCAAALLWTAGCQTAPSPALPSPAAGTATPAAPPSSASALDARLFGKVEWTAPPREVMDPARFTEAPKFQADPFAFNPESAFNGWVKGLKDGTLQFGVSIHEADGLYGDLKGRTVADIGAQYGNNLLAWKEMLGPQGRLIETDVDPNACRFMAWAAEQKGYGDRTLVVVNTFENPCLPIGQVDLVLCSQLHSHIIIGPHPRTAENRAKFLRESADFFHAIRDSLKDDQSRLVVIEGYQNRNSPAAYFNEDEAIANIQKNGFKLDKHIANNHLWAASFSRKP